MQYKTWFGRQFCLGALILGLCFLAGPAQAKLRLPAIFKDHMVLQRDTILTIWGWAEPKEQVDVFLAGVHKAVTANRAGEWKLSIGPFSAGGPHQLRLSASEVLVVSDILFGEVWLCAGEGNGLDANSLAIAGDAKQEIRFLKVPLESDIQPATDLGSAYWEIADAASIGHLPASAYYFARDLSDSLQVPVGLISTKLEGSTIETWMSEAALRNFPQFDEALDHSIASGKNKKALAAELTIYRQDWDSAYYLNSPGMEQKWYLPGTDTSGWQDFAVPGFWEDQGYPDHDGEAWFRREFDKKEMAADTGFIALNQVDDYDIAWLNGVRIGEGFGHHTWRKYAVPDTLLKDKGNVLVVRVYDIGGRGGMYTSADRGNPILNGPWKFKKGRGIHADIFPKPMIANTSIFDHPAILYNANIAPLISYRIKGVLWYAGKANAGRAAESAALLPALVKDWRRQWKQKDMPFLLVQTGNDGPPSSVPAESALAEWRASQMAVLRLPATALVATIDLEAGTAKVGQNEPAQRLVRAALQKAYGRSGYREAPVADVISISGRIVSIRFSSSLIRRHPRDAIRGFELAGADGRYYAAQASLKKRKIQLSSSQVAQPLTVRYAWADHPGPLDLYSEQGLPVLPFRTDQNALSTEGRVFEW